MRNTAITALLLLGAALAPAQADDLKLGYINKMGEHPWFVAEVAGAKAAAAEAGAKLSTQDVQFNADLTLTTFDTMVGDGVKGIAIVVPDKALGPVVAEKAAKAGIKLIAVDDDIYAQDKTPVPYIGMNATAIGRQVGAEEARLYKSLGWGDKKDVKLGSRRGPQGRHLHAAHAGRGGGLPGGRAGLRQGQHRAHSLRQHDEQRHRRRDHDLDRQSRRRALDLLLLQRRRRARIGPRDREFRA